MTKVDFCGKLSILPLLYMYVYVKSKAAILIQAHNVH